MGIILKWFQKNQDHLTDEKRDTPKAVNRLRSWSVWKLIKQRGGKQITQVEEEYGEKQAVETAGCLRDSQAEQLKWN